MSHSHLIALEITPSEWFIMRTVWAHPFCTSREIIDTVLNLTSWKEGTIKSLINRLEKKSYSSKTQLKDLIHLAQLFLNKTP